MMSAVDEKLFPAWESMGRVEDMSEGELDALPFGAIQLDANGKILRYNHTGSSTASVGLANGERMTRNPSELCHTPGTPSSARPLSVR